MHHNPHTDVSLIGLQPQIHSFIAINIALIPGVPFPATAKAQDLPPAYRDLSEAFI